MKIEKINKEIKELEEQFAEHMFSIYEYHKDIFKEDILKSEVRFWKAICRRMLSER